MAKHRLSKSTYIRSLQCQKSLYLHAKRPFLRDKISAEQLLKFRRGTDVGILARQLFPGGMDMTPKSPSALSHKKDETLTLISDPKVNVLYEAVFEHDEVLIMLDILVRQGSGWRAIEVKSSRKLSPTYFSDAALQLYVLIGNNLMVNSFSLMHINENYVFDGNLKLEELFIATEVLPELKGQLSATADSISRAKKTLDLNKSPEVAPGAHCQNPYPCDFQGHCWKHVPADNLLQLRSMNAQAASRFFAQGRFRLQDIESEPEYRDISTLEIKALSEGRLVFPNENIKIIQDLFAEKTNPLFVKLIRLQPAVPLIRGFRPYQALPLALGWHDGQIHSQLFETDEQGLMEAQKLMSHLLSSHRQVITDDRMAFDLPSVFPSTWQNETSGRAHTTLVGIRELVEDLPLYHPGFGPDYPFVNIAKVLTGIAPDDEHWIRHDLLSGDETKKQKALRNLEQYLVAISGAWEQLRQISLNF